MYCENQLQDQTFRCSCNENEESHPFMLNFRRANKSVHVIYIINGTLVELMLTPVNHYVFIDQDVDYRYLEKKLHETFDDQFAMRNVCATRLSRKFLVYTLKSFWFTIHTDCINSHSDILSFSCIDLPLKKVTHASLMVCLI